MNTIQKELKGLQHKQQLLGILLFSMVTIFVWVGISLVVSQQKTDISPALQKLALPLNPSINIDVLSELEQKKTYDASQLVNFPIYRLLSSEETLILGSNAPASRSGSLLEGLTVIPSPSPEIEASPSAAATSSATSNTRLETTDEATDSATPNQ